MRIALAQVAVTTDPAVNLGTVVASIRRAAASGAELVVFPEATLCSFARPRTEVAEPLTGPWATAVAEAADAAGVGVVVGTFTPGRTPNRVRNTLLATGVGLRAQYDKLHLFDALGYRESDTIEPGDEVVTVPWGATTLGLTTCYDVRFPELYRDLARRGAEVILVPASWAPGPRKVEQWRALVVARALDATAWIVAVDQAQPGRATTGPQPTGVGHSLVVDPYGEIVAELGAEADLVVVDLDPARAVEAREALPVLRHARFGVRLDG